MGTNGSQGEYGRAKYINEMQLALKRVRTATSAFERAGDSGFRLADRAKAQAELFKQITFAIELEIKMARGADFIESGDN